jgi:hypothetical protein
MKIRDLMFAVREGYGPLKFRKLVSEQIFKNKSAKMPEK